MLEAIDVILIHQLLGEYGHAIDHRAWDDFAELFVPDASIDYRGSSGNVVRVGRDEIVRWFIEVDRGHPSSHHVTNIVVATAEGPDGPVAVHSKFIAPFTRDHHSPKRLYGGDYLDTVVRTPAGWRFSRKECIPRWNLAVQVDPDAPAHRSTS